MTAPSSARARKLLRASLFDEIMDFANYAFNKAHAVALRSRIVPHGVPQMPPFERISLSGAADERSGCFDKISEHIQAARVIWVSRVLPPDVNESYDEFSVAGENIRFGLAAVKGVGRPFMKQLVEERRRTACLSVPGFLRAHV